MLAIDEYENLDRKLGEGVFPVDLLHMLRESIQTHRRIVWLFAGSHAIEELTHAEWPSFISSAPARWKSRRSPRRKPACC
ncbi:MAG: hypothetical protein ACOYMG_09475 [Candidatus Methylumidiphilus sp.]